ncbi:hypothetical protein BJ741DRAFT_596776 [Chytriomyces cf. hyalinus JEL632]|nr:hypothetical protein BJ741DRAFT_596776 [Chytriomyces cf. hyalinus JEL632]
MGIFEKVLACAPVVGNLDGCKLEFFDCESAESEDKVTFDEAVFGTSRLGFDVSDGARLIAESAWLMTLFEDEAVGSVCFALIWPSVSFGAVEFEMEDSAESVGFVFSEFEELRFNDKDGFAIAPDFNDPPDKDARVIPDDCIFPSVFVVAETGRFTDSDAKLDSVGVAGFVGGVAEISEASIDFSEASVKFSAKRNPKKRGPKRVKQKSFAKIELRDIFENENGEQDSGKRGEIGFGFACTYPVNC